MSDISKIIITRAKNGWILQREEHNTFDNNTHTVRDVFEDANGGLNNYIGRAESLSNLLGSFCPRIPVKQPWWLVCRGKRAWI